MPSDSPQIEVAVGVLYDGSGRVLVNERPAGKPFAGQWEFPGGKIEPGEDTGSALSRELDEELGIVVEHQRPLIVFRYDYSDTRVRLYVNEVLSYRGVVEGREGQKLDWVAPENLHRVDFLAANAAIVRAVILPRFCLITDLQRYGAPRTLERLRWHTADRRVLLIVREKETGPGSIDAFLREARSICHGSGSMVVRHIQTVGPDTDGVHLPACLLDSREILRGAGLLGGSCHGRDELALAARRGLDYALLSPVSATASHPAARPLGWSGFAELVHDVALPVYALGGLDFSDLDPAIEHGAQGVAMLGAAWR